MLEEKEVEPFNKKPRRSETNVRAKRQSKKARILDLFKESNSNIYAISYQVGARPSYVAKVLFEAGQLKSYSDLYTEVGSEPNIFASAFKNSLAFKNVDQARASVERIKEIYDYFARLGDRAGQHQAMVVALIGLNRARWSGKKAEAEVFKNWLIAEFEIK